DTLIINIIPTTPHALRRTELTTNLFIKSAYQTAPIQWFLLRFYY
ncbi:MAG: hypothetical protein ACI90V_008924, partial [Bacillariaceae sp.]